MARKRVGEVLLQQGAITQVQLEEALRQQRFTRQRLGSVLVQLGHISEIKLAQALGEALQIPLVDLARLPAPPPAVLNLLQATFCEAQGVFPIAVERAQGRAELQLALSDPLNLPALEEVKFRTGMKVTIRLAPASAVRQAIHLHYHRQHEESGGSGEFVIIQRGGAIEPVGQPTPPAASSKLEKPALAAGISEPELDETETLADLEQKFWALMRILVKKGVLTQREFMDELGPDEEK